MFSKKQTGTSISNYSEKIAEVKEWLADADAIVIGAGAGLSASAGLCYSGRRFTDHFQEFIKKYGMTDMYSAGFYPFPTPEEKWGYWSRHIMLNRYEAEVGKPYADLLELVQDKPYFVITTNVDHQFQRAGFPEESIFATQGDYGLFQCKKACHNQLYDNKAVIKQMAAEQSNCQIPTKLIPKCPVCGGEMEVNIRIDQYFVEDECWHLAQERYLAFLTEHQNDNIVFLELGVGMNTPSIIKYPFMHLTNNFPHAHLVTINQENFSVLEEIAELSIILTCDIGEALAELL